jgi:hypothetical protein
MKKFEKSTKGQRKKLPRINVNFTLNIEPAIIPSPCAAKLNNKITEKYAKNRNDSIG